MALIAILAVLVGSAIATVGSPPAARGVSASGGSSGASTAECVPSPNCPGVHYFENITVVVTGVPQFFTTGNRGSCLSAPNFIEDGCQVFVTLNLAFTQTSSYAEDWQNVPVLPGNHAYSFREEEGGTGFTGSYNVQECDVTNPQNGCYSNSPPASFSVFDYPGLNSTPYYWTIGAHNDQTNFVPGCNGEPSGMIYGPSGAPVDDSTTIYLSYNLCSGTIANDDGGDGGDGGNSSWNYSQGSWDPCPANGTNDSNCLNGTFGHLNLSEETSSLTCAACHDVINDSLPVTFGQAGITSLFLPNGTYDWNVSFLHRTTAISAGVASSSPGTPIAQSGRLFDTHPVAFTETGLPAGDSWTLWLNGTSITTNRSTILVREPNGSRVPFFILGGPPSKAGKGYVATLEGTTSFYGNLSVAGPSTETVSFAPGRTTGLSFHAGGKSLGQKQWGAISWCATALPAGLEGGAAYAVPGARFCGTGTTHTLPGFPVQLSSGGASGGFPFPAAGRITPVRVVWTVSVSRSCGTCLGGAVNPTQPDVPSGSVVLGGRPTTVQEVFSQHTQSLTLSVSRAPPPSSGWRWLVVADCSHGGIQEKLRGSSRAPVVTAPITNGTCLLSVRPAPGYQSTFSDIASPLGVVIVDGNNPHVNLTFVQVGYNVSFSQSGLPPGTNWSVQVTAAHGTTGQGYGCNGCATNVAVLGNGSYTFTVAPPSGYTASPAKGTFHVKGAGEVIVIVFARGTVAPRSGTFGVLGTLLALSGLALAPSASRTGPRPGRESAK